MQLVDENQEGMTTAQGGPVDERTIIDR